MWCTINTLNYVVKMPTSKLVIIWLIFFMQSRENILLCDVIWGKLTEEKGKSDL